MDFQAYVRGLNQAGKEAYAKRAGFSHQYIQSHLACKPPRRSTTIQGIKRLAEASEGNVSIREAIKHFLGRDIDEHEPGKGGQKRTAA